MSPAEILIIWQLAISMAGYTDWCKDNTAYCATPPEVHYVKLGKSPLTGQNFAGEAWPGVKKILLSESYLERDAKLPAHTASIGHKSVVLHEFVHRLDMDSKRYAWQSCDHKSIMERRAENIQETYLKKYGWQLKTPAGERPSDKIALICAEARAQGLLK